MNRSRPENAVLLISHDEEDHNSLRRILGAFDWTLHQARSVREAQTILRGKRITAVIADGRCWKNLLRQFRLMESPPALIVADRLADERLWAEVLNLGGYDLLRKPFEAKEVIHVLSMACRREKSSPASLAHKLHGCPEGQPTEVDTAALAHP